MSEQKSPLFGMPMHAKTGLGGEKETRPPQEGQTPTRDRRGWDAYRKWLNRVDNKPSRRAPLDASVYSWKGYQSWADKVREQWKHEDG